MNKEEKAKLWSDRIQQYQTSGQTCKQWCTENGIPFFSLRKVTEAHPNQYYFERIDTCDNALVCSFFCPTEGSMKAVPHTA